MVSIVNQKKYLSLYLPEGNYVTIFIHCHNISRYWVQINETTNITHVIKPVISPKAGLQSKLISTGVDD